MMRVVRQEINRGGWHHAGFVHCRMRVLHGQQPKHGAANQWRDALNREQVQRIVHDHRAQMQRFKYVPAGY